MQGNAKTKPITCASIIRGKAFVEGFRDKHNGKPFNGDAYPLKQQWHYERGRLFACIYSGELKQGNRILPTAVQALYNAYKDKSLC